MAAVLKNEREADDRLELARANGYLNTALINHSNAIDKETKADGLVETYTTSVNEAIETAAKSITSPRMRESFMLNAQDNAARIINSAKNKSFKLARDAGMATDIDTMNKLRLTAAVGGPNPQDLCGYHPRILRRLGDKGVARQDQAAQMKKSQAEDFARLKLATLTPAERLEALHGRAASRYGVLAAIPRLTCASRCALTPSARTARRPPRRRMRLLMSHVETDQAGAVSAFTVTLSLGGLLFPSSNCRRAICPMQNLHCAAEGTRPIQGLCVEDALPRHQYLRGVTFLSATLDQ